MPAPIPQQISRILPKFQNVAQTNHYLVKFGLPPGTVYDPNTLKGHLRSKGVDTRFQLDDVGLLCSSASLPGSALATVNTVGDYQGVVERFAHTRNFTQISLDFYVDNEYKSLKFLEHWMEYISGASQPNLIDNAYHYRMRYPEDYKSNETKIVKFERNYRQFLEYKFFLILSFAPKFKKAIEYFFLPISCFSIFNSDVNSLITSLSSDFADNINIGIFCRALLSRIIEHISNPFTSGSIISRINKSGGETSINSNNSLAFENVNTL